MIERMLKLLVNKGAFWVNFRNTTRIFMGAPWRRKRLFLHFEGRDISYGEMYQRARQYERLFLARRADMVAEGRLSSKERLAVGVYMENTPEFLAAVFGAGLSNTEIFTFNTGFRGETLSQIAEQAGIRLLLSDSKESEGIETITEKLPEIDTDQVILLDQDTIDMTLESVPDKRYARVAIDNMSSTLVIYTSGTTGLPKGVPCTHVKLFGAGAIVQLAIKLLWRDKGYVCTPLFHSSAWYVGVMPVLLAGCGFVLKRRFSASAFETDMLEHGVTYLSYVGQPLHYIVTSLEQKYGGEDGVVAALAEHPKNLFRKAYGNGAPASDRRKCMRFFRMKHIYELYGSTEAVINTVNKPGDPIDSVGKAGRKVAIFDEEGKECSPGQTDEKGYLSNYDEAVGEICARAGMDNLRFGGYYGNPEDTNKKFRDGIYHSGDLGHIRIIKGKRYLFFNGRTDDWIRKDGENFSAETVADFVRGMPGAKLAIAYGAPCAVSDEWVMATVELHEGKLFDSQQCYDYFLEQQKSGGMDPKWMPDFIRIIPSFELSATQKIVIRPFKKAHYNLEQHPKMNVYFRERGDSSYKPLDAENYQRLKKEFVDNGRESLLSF